MTDPDRLQRPYFYVAVDAPANSDAVVELLRLAADRLAAMGLLDVQDITLTASSDSSSATTGLTIYYDRVERRISER